MKLHIGCGQKYLPGYKHLDIMNYPHIDYIANANDLSLFDDESIEEIYACHILEHFTRYEIDDVLKEWNRVLMKGGGLRLAVPDFEAIVTQYISGTELNSLIGLLYGGQNSEYNFHFQAYDFTRMKELLQTAGFNTIHVNFL